ncbi:extracellular solute-binding protein [Paenibacillus sp. GD4]|jgi:putative aldouronate transport system substrate-binding protein|uniref:extracellular solute-binding protein n=1 Tax=Paenibacillus sp. GD4 TaxID=3068890 RepID=UPI002796966F|nr:extracellular solute-binding protein [Paenibacillus sp. GD4]MDQ1914864.1 extracellular solute-binding protein [Paenibacillus sp. GD4]
MKTKATWTRLGSITLAASVLLAAGCSKSEKAPAASTENGNQPLKISMMVSLQTPEVPSEDLKKLIEQKTNTQLNIQFVPSGAYEEKFQAAMVTDSLPEISYLGNQNSFINFRDAIKNQQFWEVGPYLKDYPNLSKLNPDVLKNTAVDGKIYTLYQEVPLTRQGIIYRKDLADKLGITPPKTTEDIYNMLKKFKESGVAIPLADRNDLVYGSFKTLSSWFGTPNNWGLENGKLVPEFMTKQYMDTMNFMKRLHKEGLINQDFPVTSKADQQNMMYSGKSAVYIGSMPDVQTMHAKTQSTIKTAEYDVTNAIVKPDGKNGVWAVPGYSTVIVFPKTAVKTEEHLKKLLAFCDKLFDPEIANLMQYGVEGTHYNLKDGKVEPIADVKKIEKDVKAYWGLSLSRVTNIKPKVYDLPVAEKADQLVADATKFAINDPTAPLHSATYTERGPRLQEIIKDATYKYILGGMDENGFQAEIKKWQEQGGAKIIEEYNASLTQSNTQK